MVEQNHSLIKKKNDTEQILKSSLDSVSKHSYSLTPPLIYEVSTYLSHEWTSMVRMITL